MTGRGGSVTPAETLIETPPPDDAGAETMGRFDWQAMMATADILAAYYERLGRTDGKHSASDFKAICEHHEDWALCDGGDAEIISAKHKEAPFGAFTTLRMLLDEGGVLHLFDRWLALDRSPRCRLVTTAGLNGDARLLEQACQKLSNSNDPNLEKVAQWENFLTKLTNAIEASRAAKGKWLHRETPATLVEFLRVLRIDHSLPRRDQVPFMAVNAYAAPVASRLGRTDAATAIWSAVLDIVRERMRAAGPNPRGSLPKVLGAQDEANYMDRTVTLAQLQIVVAVAIKNPHGYEPLPRKTRTSKVAVKMVEGGCSDNSVERAETLRLQYRNHWRQQMSGPMKGAGQLKIANLLHRIIDEATHVVRDPTTRWGAELWREIEIRLEGVAQADVSQGLDLDLLLGGVSDLSNLCKAWFSDGFDVAARTKELAADVRQ